MKNGRKDYIQSAKQEASQIILAALEKGVAPWIKPYVLRTLMDTGFKANAPYKGQNTLLAYIYRIIMGYSSRLWLTWSKYQALKKEHPEVRMKAGSKSIPIILWQFAEKKDADGNTLLDEDGNPKEYGFMKVYRVFNADCFEGFDFSPFEPKQVEVQATEEEILTAEEMQKRLLDSYEGHPEILYDESGTCPYYRPSNDTICLVPSKYYKSPEAYFSVLAHELIHSTGAQNRLGRLMEKDHSYSFEELVAEMGASIICAEHGILSDTVEMSAAYIEGWSKSLKKNPDWFWDAYSEARKAAAVVLGKADAA